MSASPPSWRRRFTPGRIIGTVVSTLVFLSLFLPLWRASYPPLASRITLEVTFARGFAGFVEPLIVTGNRGDGDFLAIRYLDTERAEIFYDVWGVGGPASKPFALRAGERRTLEIEMPTLPHVPFYKSHEKRPLKVVLDGAVLLDEPVYFHRRQPQEIYFARNEIGGNLVREKFRGKLTFPGGRELAGGPDTVFGFPERLLWFARSQLLPLLWRIGASVAAGFALAWILPRCFRFRPRPPRPYTMFPTRTRAPHGWFLATAAICTLAFTVTITGGTFRLIFDEMFSELYDYQAQSFLEGRLDLPNSTRNSESFIFEGRNYMYFGPTPAVLRLPFAIFKTGFGHLSRSYMVGYYIALLFAVYAIQRHVARVAGGPDNQPSAFSVVVFGMTAGMGTTLFFLASRSYVYHEAILCGAMFAVWSGYFSLRYLAEPKRSWWAGAVFCGLASVHARPPSGLFALALIGCAAIAVMIRKFQNDPAATDGPDAVLRTLRKPVLVGVLAAVSILSFNGLSYLKFRSFEGAPLKYHVMYQTGRLDNIGGKNFHLSNLPLNTAAYLWRPDFEWKRGFPFFYLVSPKEYGYREARMDLTEPTLAIPYAMPALFALALVGGLLALSRWHESREPLIVVAAGAAPMFLALFTAVAISQRYTGDFCPPMILIGAFGLQSLELLSVRWRRAAMVMCIALAAFSVFVTMALTLHHQGAMVWGVPDDVRERYESLRKAVDTYLGFRSP